jgi:nucleoside-diphosphate-sugar epimerase
MMHILLTGATGYVGSRLARLLVSRGYAVTELPATPGRQKNLKSWA